MKKKLTSLVPRLDELPERVRFVRKLRNGLSMLECSHPQQWRKNYTHGPREGNPYCGLCKGDDLGRSCVMVADLAEAPAPPDPQVALF